VNIFRNERHLGLQNQIPLPLFQDTTYKHFDVFDFTLRLSEGGANETWKYSKITFSSLKGLASSFSSFFISSYIVPSCISLSSYLRCKRLTENCGNESFKADLGDNTRKLADPLHNLPLTENEPASTIPLVVHRNVKWFASKCYVSRK